MHVLTCRWWLTAALATSVLALAACTPEQRPTSGSVKTIGTPPGAASTGNASQSVSAPAPAAAPQAPAVQTTAANPTAAPKPAAAAPQAPAKPTPAPPSAPDPDGIYTPTTNREIYQLIASDYQEIVALTNAVNDGKPLPSDDILKVYEESKQARLGTQTRPLRTFAREEARATEFPDAARFFGSNTFLDDPVMEAISGSGSARDYSPAQRRQAIQKGVLNIVHHWSRRYVLQAAGTLNPGQVDEAWAIYVGKLVDGKYPNSLAATALSRETNFNRPNSLDAPLRRALSRAQQAANGKDQAGYDAAARDVYSRFNAIFYLSSARYLNEAVKSVGRAMWRRRG
jgi:hypothetical protein